LRVTDYDREEKTLTIRGQNSKTNCGRVIPVGLVPSQLLERYIDEVRTISILMNLFLNYKGKPLNSGYISKLVSSIRKEVGNKAKAISHSFRKSSATHMLRNGARLETVQALLGHTEITSTQVYTKVYPKDIIQMHRGKHPREREKNMSYPELRVLV
jgi:integrase/recombinase XerD